MSASALDVVARFFEHLEAKRVDEVAALYAEDVGVWHNFSNATQSKAENLEVLKGLTASVDALRYEIVERLALDDGRVLQRHRLCCRADDEEVVIPACMMITVRDGRIALIEEYLDSGQANALRAASGRERIGGG